MTREEVAQYRAQVIMAVCGLSHTNNTKVGNDFIRGVVGFTFLCSPDIVQVHVRLTSSVVRRRKETCQHSRDVDRWRFTLCVG